MAWTNYILSGAAEAVDVDGYKVVLPAGHLIIGPLANCDAVFSPATSEEFRLKPGEVGRLTAQGMLRVRP